MRFTVRCRFRELPPLVLTIEAPSPTAAAEIARSRLTARSLGQIERIDAKVEHEHVSYGLATVLVGFMALAAACVAVL